MTIARQPAAAPPAPQHDAELRKQVYGAKREAYLDRPCRDSGLARPASSGGTAAPQTRYRPTGRGPE